MTIKEEVEQYAERLGASVIFEDIDKTIDAYTSLEDHRYGRECENPNAMPRLYGQS